MRKLFSSSLILFFSFFIISCSPKIPFTQSIREKYKLNETELKSIQFYTSENIVLKRGEMNANEKETKEGTLTIKSGSSVEQVVIKAGTPCVVEQVVDKDKVTLSFDDGSDKYLVFGSLKNQDGYYTMMALEWIDNKGKVEYGGKTYYAAPGANNVFLLFKMKSLDQFKVDQKVAKGKRV